MHTIIAILGIVIILGALWDAFETIVLPRRVSRRIRLTRLVFSIAWIPVALVARHIRSTRNRERLLGPFGPLVLIVLLATWMVLLIVGYALLQWADGSHLANPTGPVSFGTDLYMSGTTILTLGLGDVTPIGPMARFITVIEAATGFGLLALVIGYLPVLYQAFSRREVNISLLDARAGSPPVAVELLRRHGLDDRAGLVDFLRDWERWSAELLESHLSYPFLAYFRSQHENQSWLAALTMIMDTCALVLTGIDALPKQTARLTFAMARHASVDLSQVLLTHPNKAADRLSSADFATLRASLHAAGLDFRDDATAEARLAAIRRKYEPFVAALAHRLLIDLPAWLPTPDAHDDWETSIWEGGERMPATIAHR
jgi:hypothetical protein